MTPPTTSLSSIPVAAPAPSNRGTKRLVTIGGTINNTCFMLISCTAIVIVVASSILSVDAIRCHQCNSHINPNCASLSAIPSSNNDEYLGECSGLYDGHIPFCRKTQITIEHTEEKRIIRSCGWVNDNKKETDRCINADNEGYLESVCVCFSDGCNSAPNGFKSFSLFMLVLGPILSLLIRFV